MARLGPDEQEPDRRPPQQGNPAMMGEANGHPECGGSMSGRGRAKETRPTLGGLWIYLEEPNYDYDNGASGVQRSQ